MKTTPDYKLHTTRKKTRQTRNREEIAEQKRLDAIEEVIAYFRLILKGRRSDTRHTHARDLAAYLKMVQRYDIIINVIDEVRETDPTAASLMMHKKHVIEEAMYNVYRKWHSRSMAGI